jgi:rubrerythrin
MEKKKFNPLDPLGIFEGSSPEEKPDPARQEAIKQLSVDIRAEIADEANAAEMYTRLSTRAEQVGLRHASRTLLAIAQDEARHRRELEDMINRLW